MTDILVVYYSSNGATEALAREVCRGIDSVGAMASRLRTVPQVSAVSEAVQSDIPESGPPYATPKDLAECAGLVMGSPTRFGNMDEERFLKLRTALRRCGTAGEIAQVALRQQPSETS